MKNPLDKLKKKKVEEEGPKNKDTDSKKASTKGNDASRSIERRKAFTEKPFAYGNSEDNTYDIKFKHLIETELNVILKKAKSLYLKTEGNFAEKSDDNYWKVSVNEFMRYINERSQIIIDQLSKKSHAVDIKIDDSDE